MFAYLDPLIGYRLLESGLRVSGHMLSNSVHDLFTEFPNPDLKALPHAADLDSSVSTIPVKHKFRLIESLME